MSFLNFLNLICGIPLSLGKLVSRIDRVTDYTKNDYIFALFIILCFQIVNLVVTRRLDYIMLFCMKANR